jgi:hypothetical protein
MRKLALAADKIGSGRLFYAEFIFGCSPAGA